MTETGKQEGYLGHSTEVDPAFMHELYISGVIGTKEFRSWLAKVSPSFNEVRDADVDNEIDRLARERSEALRAKRDTSQPVLPSTS